MDPQDSQDSPIQTKELKRGHQSFVVPESSQKLRACTQCGLVKTQQEWTIQKICENCGPLKHAPSR